MPDFHTGQSDGCVQLPQGLVQALFTDDIVSRYVRMTGIDARANWNDSIQPVEDFGNLLKASSQRELGPGSVFDQNCQATLPQIESLRRGGDSCRGAQQPLFSISAPKRSRMQDQVIRT